MELEELFKDRSSEEISAFAFNIGKMIEAIVKDRMVEIQERNTFLEARIVEFRKDIKAYYDLPELLLYYDIHFNIKQG